MKKKTQIPKEIIEKRMKLPAQSGPMGLPLGVPRESMEKKVEILDKNGKVIGSETIPSGVTTHRKARSILAIIFIIIAVIAYIYLH